MSGVLDDLVRRRMELRRELAEVTQQIDAARAGLEQPELNIGRPGKSGSSDFYKRVADVYSRAFMLTHHPAAAIAAASDVPVTSVHRWIREARRRGLLARATRKGAAG